MESLKSGGILTDQEAIELVQKILVDDYVFNEHLLREPTPQEAEETIWRMYLRKGGAKQGLRKSAKSLPSVETETSKDWSTP